MSNNQVIIGINAFHGDASAAGLSGGVFRVGVEEERFTRIKHWAGFPEQSIRHCLAELTGGAIEDVTALAVSRQPKAYFWRKVMLAPRSSPAAHHRPSTSAGTVHK